MKLYSRYLLFTFKNALRFPKYAFKILPGLLFSLIGLIITVYFSFTIERHQFHSGLLLDIIKMPLFMLSFVVGLSLISIYKSNMTGARASDASFLMPAPITPFQFYVFMSLKSVLSLVSLVGLPLIYIPFYSQVSLSYLVHPLLILPIYFSSLYLVYILGYIDYVIKTSHQLWIRLIKYAIPLLFIGFIALLIITIQQIGIINTLTNSIVLYYPLIGWVVGLMSTLASGHLAHAILFASLLTISLIASHYWAKSSSYNYYEEELAAVQKIEALYQRAYSNKGIELKPKFQRTTKHITHANEKVLLDIAWIRAGKYWYLRFGTLLKWVIILVVLLIPVNKSIQSNSSYAQFFAFAMLIATGYIRLFSINNNESPLTTDTYLALLPIKTIYKLIYPLAIHVYHVIFYTIGCFFMFSLSLLFNHHLLLADFILWTSLIFCMDLFDLIRTRILQPLTLERFTGKFIQTLINFVIVLLSHSFMFMCIHLFSIPIALVISIIFFILLIGIVLYLGIKSYDYTEKCKQDTMLF
ncbi:MULTISPECIES: putative ABC exporter domain-containing protein [unclassified Granulicatella]|uniref:putative ABC exporter domain-containing protein n=1 Tax=unclassified Granulicatella TaxID=2630493 RepID=UPI00143221B6|nr:MULTISPECIES: putative ABC exporter domain-containing protein [unclassified Granulicatella]MBF0779754.1 hypothetical protein [Granulicatella sp. 19428wC4_WM01]